MSPRGGPPGALVLTSSPPTTTQTLLWEAHQVELQRQKEVEKLERQLALPSTEQAATQVSRPCQPHIFPRAWPPAWPDTLSLPQETTFREMCQGLLEESDEEEKDRELGRGQDRAPEATRDQDGGAEAPATPARLAAVDKKTEQQRRREKAARMLVSPMGSVCPLGSTICFSFPPAYSLSSLPPASVCPWESTGGLLADFPSILQAPFWGQELQGGTHWSRCSRSGLMVGRMGC